MSLARLREALTAIGRGDHAVARDALVAEWRMRRAPALAELVDILEPRAPDELTATLAAIVTPRVATSHANLKRLAKIDDPRLATWTLAALANPPFCAPTAEPFLVALATTIDRLADQRLAATLPDIRRVLAARVTRKPIYTKVIAKLDAASARCPAPRAATKAELDLERELAVACEPLRPRAIESLFAEVYAKPNDDAPRMVLADALLERGDPRGEFIMLQLARARDAEATPRELELLKQHGKTWLGALATVLSFGKGYSSTVFQRGFVAEADFIFKVEKKLRLIVTDPGWSTVERVKSGPMAILLEHAPLRALREIDLDDETIEALARRTEPFASVANVRCFDVVPFDLLRRLFPALAVLSFDVIPSDVEAIAALGVREIEIDMYCSRDDLAARSREYDAFVARLPGMRACLDRLAVRPPWFDYRDKAELVIYTRGAAGTFVT